jgi:hypothetical protein
MADDFGELVALMADATPGPWVWDGLAGNDREVAGGAITNADGSHCVAEADGNLFVGREADLRLMVAAVNALPALMAILKERGDLLSDLWFVLFNIGDGCDAAQQLESEGRDFPDEWKNVIACLQEQQ